MALAIDHPGGAADLPAQSAAAGPGGNQNPELAPLPELRDDLQLFPGPPTYDGASTWTVYDPVRGRYFRLGREAFEMLARWQAGSAAAVAAAVIRDTTVEVAPADVLDMVRFLRANCLVRVDNAQGIEGLVHQVNASKRAWYKWIVHNYLFVRIPLVRPDRMLTRTMPLLRPLFSRPFMTILMLLGALGVYLALRQWDAFLNTFLYFFSPTGAVFFGFALVFTKILHELGHGYQAKRFGCRVPSMGVAFLVMFPVLFTDTTESWRLNSRRQRLMIGAGGILVELSLAMLATLLWSFLPDGPARSAAFLVATVTWITTLAVNLNPFMRFDGYYLLTDFLGMQNLQQRAFALGRWQLREWLFGLKEPEPEVFQPGMRRILTLYAFGTWIYRFFLFLGIALLVYHFFFKVLGITLMVIELIWFIGMPIWNEIKQWWQRRGTMRLNLNTAITLTVLGGFIWLMATPWHAQIGMPGILRAEAYGSVFAPVPARIVAIDVERGETVGADQVMLRLEAPELDHQIAQAEREMAVLQLQILRQTASGEGLEEIGVLQQRLATALTTQQGLLAQQEALELRAPVGGTVVELSRDLRPGLWVRPDQPLARVVAPQTADFVAYVDGGDRDRVAVGAAAEFIPDDPSRPPIGAVVIGVEDVNAAVLDQPYLASVFDGAIAVRQNDQGGLVPEHSVYRVILHPATPMPAPDQVVRGVVQVEGEARSFFDRIWRAVAAVLIRESGF